MVVARSVDGIPVRLTAERWSHVVRGHPEMQGQDQRVMDTVRNPERILQGDRGELLAVRFYGQTPITSKNLVVVYRETSTNDGFVITASFTRRTLAGRTVLWQQ